MNGPSLVCSLCGQPTSIYKPICNNCLRAAGIEPNDCPHCLRGLSPERGLHHNATGGYIGKCSAPEGPAVTVAT